jgi:hypothetical protein
MHFEHTGVPIRAAPGGLINRVIDQWEAAYGT